MKAERWQRIKAIFNEAVELPADRQRKFVFEACADDSEIRSEVEKMLDVDAADDVLEQNAFDFLPGTNGDFSDTPEMLGKYKIISEIGRGGMGAVYLAERADGEFKLQVAVKLIKRGMDSEAILRRFRNERQILAELRHPHIARLLDGGVSSEGTPFYAMEYIEGVPIDEYCKDKKISEKLLLFRRVCAAVTYAHNHLVVHRDLKPSNILVEPDGTPKLLDFGIAKVLNETEDSGTATQLGMMTPAYASPEQIRGEKVSTASDVYSLGVVLYELLTGVKPYETDGKSHIEVMNLVCHSELSRPSLAVIEKPKIQDLRLWKRSKSVKRMAKSENVLPESPKPEIQNLKSDWGDLDNILLKALQKAPDRRYQSAQEFSEDIRRHLVGLPINARPDTFSYLFGKFIKRNRASVVAAVLIFVSLCVGFAVAVWQRERAERQRALAENRFQQVRQLANNVVFKYHDAIADLPGATAAREMLVTDALQYLDNLSDEASDNPELERELAAAYLKLGDVQGKQYEANIGDTAGARKSYEKAVSLLEAAVKTDEKNTAAKVELIKAYDALFANMMRYNETGKAETLDKALNLIEQTIAAEPENAQLQLHKAQLLMRRGDIGATFQDALNTYLQALSIAEKLYQADIGNTEYAQVLARICQRVGTNYVRLGDEASKKGENPKEFYGQALSFHRKSLDAVERLYLADERNLPARRRYAVSLINLAETMAKNGQKDEQRMERALQLFKQTAEEDAKNLEARLDVAFTHSTRAQIMETLGESEQAIREYENVVAEAAKVRRTDADNAESGSLLKETYEKMILLCELQNQPEKVKLYRQKLNDLEKSQ